LEGLRRYALGEEREHVLLAGRPGSGKSMALRQLVVGLAWEVTGQAPQPPSLGGHERVEGQIPVLVQLKGNVPILKAIADELENGDLELSESKVKRLLRHHHHLLRIRPTGHCCCRNP
jgi:hypothetical protein